MTLDASTTSRLDALLDSAAEPLAPGLAVVVVQGGAVAYQAGRGMANLEYQVPITPSTPFHIASMSKQFTAFALALVAERGLLDLDADIREHLSYVPDLGAPITARQLAHHTSGLREQFGALVLTGRRMDDVLTTLDVLDLVRRTESLNFAPGTGFSYSNTGYTLMAELIRAVDGRSLREFSAEEIFVPLGMSGTHVHDRHDEIVPGCAYSYLPTADGRWKHAHLMFATEGSGSVHTTVEDLARWHRSLDERTLAPEQVYELLDQPGVLADGTETGYAFGLMHDTYRGQRRVHHAGGVAGFRTQGERYPALRLGTYVVANTPTVDVVTVARQISDVILDQLGAPADTTPPGRVHDPHSFAGRYLDPTTGWTLTVTQDEQQLTCLGAPVVGLAPDVLRAGTTTLRFAPDRDSVEMTMTAMQPRTLVRAPEDVVVDTGLVGRYWSDELDAGFDVELADRDPDRRPDAGHEEALVLWVRTHGRLPLVPTAADHFMVTVPGVWPMHIAVAFDRAADGTVSGLRLSMPRIDNIRARPVP